MRAVNLLCVAAVASAADEVSWDEAKCVMEGKSIAFMGDSISRNCFYVFNKFLDTGEIEWTDWERFSFVKESHRCYFKKEFDDIDATSEFWFLQKAWSDRSDTDGEQSVADIAGDVAKADIAVINSGWWDLKEDDDADRYCGDDFGKDDCEKDYKASLEKLVDNILSKVDVPLFRETSCCGEDDGEKWIDAIEDANDAAKEVMGAAGVGVVGDLRQLRLQGHRRPHDGRQTPGPRRVPPLVRRNPPHDRRQAGFGLLRRRDDDDGGDVGPELPRALTKKACKKKKNKAYCKWKSKACQTKSCASFSTKKKCKKNASCRWRKKAEKCKSKA
ncbi:hypothetical protein JL721_740 [Aureococcus anophagefferens]|nr:hypothetical protein JL721_740 [Aureococcus anophagefferens]